MIFNMPADTFLVVETLDGEEHLGLVTLDQENSVAFVQTGLAGRPIHLGLEEIAAVTPAAEHPDFVAA